LDEAEARLRFACARLARLATTSDGGRPHLVPITFALVGDTVWSAVDDVKPKSSKRLRRLANVAARPAVSLLADHWDDENWSRLWWVRADGTGSVVQSVADFPEAVDALCARYPQYAARPPAGPALAVRVSRWAWWTALG
jgi:PPOX class probable F420-dependent enzyme